MAFLPSPGNRLLWVLFAIAAASAIATILYAGRGLSFHYDEWDFITGRRGVSPDTLLGSHNGHLSLLPVAYYKVGLQAVGMEEYWVFRMALGLAHTAVGGLVFVLLRDRVGGSAALIGSVLVLFLGAAWEGLVWAFQIGFVFSVLFGLGAMAALDRQSRRGNLAAGALLALSVGCSSVGVPFLLGVCAELGLSRRWRRLGLVVGPSVALYGLWYLGWGGSDVSADNLAAVPPYVFAMLSAAASGLVGLSGTSAGPAAALAVAALLAWAAASGGVTPRFAGLAAATLAVWTLTALARAQYAEPEASRYVYPSAILVVLLLGEALRGRRLPVSARPVVAVLTVLAVAGGVAALSRGAGTLRETVAAAVPRLAALEIVGASARPDFRPAPDQEPQVIAGSYLPAVADFGSPSMSESELVAANAVQRASADQVIREILAPVLMLRDAGPVDATTCRTVMPGGQAAVPAAGIALIPSGRDRLAVRIRRYGDAPTADPVIEVLRSGRLVFPPDRGQRPWFVQITGQLPARVCD